MSLLQPYVKAENIINNPDIMYKFGQTSQRDAERRFDPEVHRILNWEKVCIGEDYNYKCLWSAWVPKEKARDLEQIWKHDYPKNIWNEKDYNGGSECRYFTEEEYKNVLKKLYGSVHKRDSARQEGYVKVYLMKFTKK